MNKAYKRIRSLFQQRFGRIPITSNEHLSQLVIYIHQNPQKHGLIDDFRKWPYSSYQELINSKRDFLNGKEVIGWFNEVDTFIYGVGD